jgi:hypothetical protein
MLPCGTAKSTERWPVVPDEAMAHVGFPHYFVEKYMFSRTSKKLVESVLLQNVRG